MDQMLVNHVYIILYLCWSGMTAALEKKKHKNHKKHIKNFNELQILEYFYGLRLIKKGK